MVDDERRRFDEGSTSQRFALLSVMFAQLSELARELRKVVKQLKQHDQIRLTAFVFLGGTILVFLFSVWVLHKEVDRLQSVAEVMQEQIKRRMR